MRSTLPPRRESTGFTFTHEGVSYAVTTSLLPGCDCISEIFINAGKLGSSVHILAREAAVLLSIARQHGAPLETLEGALPKLETGEPAGPVGIALKMAREQ